MCLLWAVSAECVCLRSACPCCVVCLLWGKGWQVRPPPQCRAIPYALLHLMTSLLPHCCRCYCRYLDTTCTMGYCCSDRCPNTPHAWQMGWLSVQQLDGTSLKAGQTVRATLLSQAVTSSAGLRIVPSWVAGVDPVFVGFRTKRGGDAGLEPHDSGKVHVHTAAIANTFDAKLTIWRAGLVATQTWSDATTGLVVRVTSISKGSAAITVCRKGGAETLASCKAGLDYNCNGLVGANDPACAKLLQLQNARKKP